MSIFFKRNKELVFVDLKITTPIPEDGIFDIVLSPSLYWVRRFALPVKTTKEAKKLLPSLFEEYLPNTKEFVYEGYFEKNGEFLAFAYCYEDILNVCKQHQIDIKRIGNVYFAQDCFAKDTTVLLDDSMVLTWYDGIVLCLPTTVALKDKAVNLEKKYFQSGSLKITFVNYNSIIEQKTLQIILIVLIGFIILNVIEIFVTKQTIATLQEEKKAIFKKNHLLPTTFQNKAELKRLKKIAKKQKKLQHFLVLLEKIPLTKGEKFYKLDYKNNKAVVVFEGVTNKEKFLRYFSEFQKDKVSFKDKTLRLEFVW